MDRPPYYADPRDPRASASRPIAPPRGDEDVRRGIDRLPPVLPTSHSLPKLPLGRSDGLPPLGHSRLPPIKDVDSASYPPPRRYASMPDRPPFDRARRTSPNSSIPAGMVGSDYMRRSPPESVPPPYHPSHIRHPDPYRQEMIVARPSSHMPHHMAYDLPPAHMRHASEVDGMPSGTPIKRPRVSLACLACRNRKSRCDGVRPTCKTCANMKIECKWPEVDFRRAKTGDAARARKRSPGGPSGQRSPEASDQKSLDGPDAATNMYGRPSTALTPSQSVPMLAGGAGPNSALASSTSSPTMARTDRYRTLSDGDRENRYSDAHLSASIGSSDRQMQPPYSHESRSDLYARSEAHGRPYSSSGIPASRPDASAPWQRDDRSEAYGQERRTALETSMGRSIRTQAEPRTPRANVVATMCKRRAAVIAVLARPFGDAKREFVEANMSREASLEDLADRGTAGERLDRAFAADWESIGGLTQAARRPFMDIAAGMVGLLEVFESDAQRGLDKPSTKPAALLHIFRLRKGAPPHPDLRHLSIAMDLSAAQERDILESTSSAYDMLSYPIPVDRVALPLVDTTKQALTYAQARFDDEAERARASSRGRSPVYTESTSAADVIPFVRQQDVKPPSAILEVCFQAYVKAIGDQMPGLDTEIIGARIRDGSISALLANALCAIGASLYERAGCTPPNADIHSSKVYMERARALIGAALQNPDLEAILALGVMAIRGILMGQIVASSAIVSSAIRLCVQLDLHRARPAGRQPSPMSDVVSEDGGRAHKLVADDVFWMTYCLDRLTAIGTARPLVIKDRDIDTTFPATMRKGEPCIFAALVRQLHYLGRLSEVASSPLTGAGYIGGTDMDRALEAELAAISADLVAHYESLPTVLQLSQANLRRTHERGESISFLQLHLTHNMALHYRFFLSNAPITNAEYDQMRAAARDTVEICRMGESVSPTLLADTPLSAVACFVAACVALAELEFLEEQMQALPNSSTAGQIEVVQSTFAKLTDTLNKHASVWPIAKRLVGILEQQKTRTNSPRISAETLKAVVAQMEAVHIVVRRPGEATERLRDKAAKTPVQVQKVHDLDRLRAAFPHLC